VTGKFGNKLDAKAGKELVADSDSDDSGSDSDAGEGPRKGLMQQKKREEAGICCSHSVTEPCCMQTIDRRYGFIPIDSTKPCLYTVCMFEDFRKRHFHANILNRVNEDLVISLALDHCLSLESTHWFISVSIVLLSLYRHIQLIVHVSVHCIHSFCPQ